MNVCAALAWAHPRACGENLAHIPELSFPAGSSPRMRGKHTVSAGRSRRRGLIPAHAGKTREPGKARSQARAHPRACGENVSTVTKRWPRKGSSPRMRGKRLSPAIRDLAPGLIPAHAGKTHPKWGQTIRWWAHPRACGENIRHVTRKATLTGSSPRMRGKLIGK